MSRVEPGRYILLTLAQRDQLLALLPESTPAELASRLRYAPFQDVRPADENRADALAILSVKQEQQLNDAELADLMTIGFGVMCGLLGANEATRGIRDVVDARIARRQSEEAAS